MPQSETQQGLLYGVNCSGVTCLATGQNGLLGAPPFILQSADSGVTWSYATLPDNVTSASLNTVLCIGTLCLSGGAANGTPLVAQSSNGGISWSYPTLPDSVSVGNFTGIDSIQHGE